MTTALGAVVKDCVVSIDFSGVACFNSAAGFIEAIAMEKRRRHYMWLV